jgi:hypothetical protein
MPLKADGDAAMIDGALIDFAFAALLTWHPKDPRR